MDKVINPRGYMTGVLFQEQFSISHGKTGQLYFRPLVLQFCSSVLVAEYFLKRLKY